MEIFFDVDAYDVLHHSVRSGPPELFEDGYGKMEQDGECSQYRPIRNPLNHNPTLVADQKARIRPMNKPFILYWFTGLSDKKNPKKQALVPNVWALRTWVWTWASLYVSVGWKALGMAYCR
jgi:hypothetical protein